MSLSSPSDSAIQSDVQGVSAAIISISNLVNALPNTRSVINSANQFLQVQRPLVRPIPASGFPLLNPALFLNNARPTDRDDSMGYGPAQRRQADQRSLVL
jgi:hypothetical protein